MAGRWYAKQHDLTFSSLLLLSGAVLVGTFSCELFSSGGYYLFSGEFASSLVKYYPSYLSSTALYVTLAAMIHGIIAGLQNDY